MKIEELRKIIYEEVQKAIRVELRSMLTEIQVPAAHNVHYTQTIQDKARPFSITDMLQETAGSMTRDDYHNIVGNSVIQTSEPMINESIENDMSGLPSFVKNAKAILDASVSKDKERHGL